MFLHKIWFWKLGGWRNYHATKEKWHQILNLSDFWLEVLSMQLAVLEFNFSWDTLNGCNCCFIRQILPGDHPLSTNAKFLKKTNIFNPLIRKRTCAYQGVRNVSFSEIFAFVLNELPLWKLGQSSLALNMQLAILEVSFGWFILSGCNYFYTKFVYEN